MPEVVPAILEYQFEEIQKKVKIIKQYTNFIQLDVMDGVFVPNETFRDPAKIAELDIEIELHLMIDKPAFAIQQWALPNVRRIIFHYEAAVNVKHVIEEIKKVGKEAAVAINPPTTSFDIREVLDDLDMVLVMGVDPGFSGQQFQNDVLEKIKELKKFREDILIEVDGGVNGMNRDKIVAAGADILAAASYIWKADDIAEAFSVLRDGKKR